MTLMPGKLLLALGSKFEKNTFTGLEVQPSASLLWNRSDRDTAWISVARAARTPLRVDHDRFSRSPVPGDRSFSAKCWEIRIFARNI
jgi:iron complex outermembrane receptor protein